MYGDFIDEYNDIVAVSWHGYYQFKDNHIDPPRIHFKTNNNRYAANLIHSGTINWSEPFAMPICSLYIPLQMDWILQKKVSTYTAIDKEIYKFINIDAVDKNENCRVDIFLLPHDIKAEAFLPYETSEAESAPVAGFIYMAADIELYNLPKSPLFPIREFEYMYQGHVVSLFHNKYTLKGGYQILVRIVKSQHRLESKFNKLEGTYSLLIHNPNDAFARVANRGYFYPGDKMKTVKDELYNMALNQREQHEC